MTTSFLHEGGLTATSHSESKDFFERYGLRPILEIESSSGINVQLLLSKNGGPLGFPVSVLYSTPIRNPALLSHRVALVYDLGATIYHCVNLAKAYASIVHQYKKIQSIPGYVESESSVASFGRQLEPYYELDALLSASRRAYDKIGHCVWQAFGGGGGGMPNNLSKLLERCTRCPELLKERLRSSWLTVGSKLKDYRDCTQHFASTDLGLGHVTMTRIAKGLWSARAPIPDNPGEKSKRKFIYAANHDALTYGWEVVNEVGSLAEDVVAAIAVSPRALEEQ